MLDFKLLSYIFGWSPAVVIDLNSELKNTDGNDATVV